MTENKEIKKGKKTLSLKLGSKPIISNKRGIEAGKTVIVEKKRYKRNTNTDQKPVQAYPNKKEVKKKQHIVYTSSIMACSALRSALLTVKSCA
jgi:hypothetical protein